MNMNRLRKKTTSAERYRYYVVTELAELAAGGFASMYVLGSLAEEKGSMSSIVISAGIAIGLGIDSTRRSRISEGMIESGRPIDDVIETTGYEVVNVAQISDCSTDRSN
jgi:hypothetical protein